MDNAEKEEVIEKYIQFLCELQESEQYKTESLLCIFCLTIDLILKGLCAEHGVEMTHTLVRMVLDGYTGPVSLEEGTDG